MKGSQRGTDRFDGTLTLQGDVQFGQLLWELVNWSPLHTPSDTTMPAVGHFLQTIKVWSSDQYARKRPANPLILFHALSSSKGLTAHGDRQ